MKYSVAVIYSLLLVCLATQLFLPDELMSFSINFQKSVQKVNLTAVSYLFSYPVMMLSVGCYLVYGIFVSHDKIRAVFDLLFIFGGNPLVVMLKLLFSQERPYMHIDGPKALDCECDFGFPSGHSFFGFLIAVLIYDKIFRRNRELFL